MTNASASLAEPAAGRVIAASDPRFAQLQAVIQKHSVMKGDFTLASGRKSTYLFQLRQTTMLPEGQYLIGSIIVDFMRRMGLKTIGGLELGAVPIVTAVSFASHLASYPVDAFFVRKAMKTHGAKELVDGHVADGAEVLMVDDVTTTGGSTLKAVDALMTERSCTVRRALSVIDREEGARENFAARGIELTSIFTTGDFDLS